jgi:homoserine kinase
LNEILLRAPATIANVGPGFDIFAFALDTPFDLFKVALRGAPGTISILLSGADGEIPSSADRNTAGVAARHVLTRLGSKAGVTIEIHKHMPPCAGLGSSAASAAAAVFGLGKLLAAHLNETELVDAARQGEVASGGTPHADNAAACLLGGFVFIRSYDPLNVVRLPMPEVPIIVRVQRKTQTTTRGRIRENFSLADVKRQMALCAEVMRAVATGDVEAFGRSINADLISEPVRSGVIASYKELKHKALDAGAWGVNVCGGGSSMFAIAPAGRIDDIAALFRAARLPDGRIPEVLVTKSSNRGVEVVDGL